MIEKIKEKIWELLKDKEVSLAMIFDNQGEILWHRGREILDAKILRKGCGYCSTWIFRAIHGQKGFRREGCSVAYPDMQSFDSARQLNIKSLVILPLTNQYFLYLDSGVKKSFNEKDITVFDTLGSLLGGMIQNMHTGISSVKKITGDSTEVAKIREKIVKYAIEEDPVLLLGETGVGKNHVAEMIHLYSGRPGPFVVINTPGIPDTLIEAQLFGHHKGAFTGAVGENEGFVAAAAGGTIFLDEIAELVPPLQAKLLRFIDTKMYHRLGESSERKANVRIIAATNQDLLTAIANKCFREDLFFRLNCLSIEIPPLRRRREDIAVLIEENCGLLRGKALAREALEVLQNYDWPGNVRELIQVLKVAGIQFERGTIGGEIANLLTFRYRQVRAEVDKAEQIWQDLRSGQSFWEAVKLPYLKRDITREDVKKMIGQGLKETKGKYVGLLKLFNLPENEYKNFMRFLYANKLK